MSTALMRLKIAVLAPMPKASVSTATAVKPGFFNSWRKANFKSFMDLRLAIESRVTSSRFPNRKSCHSQRSSPLDTGLSRIKPSSRASSRRKNIDKAFLRIGHASREVRDTAQGKLRIGDLSEASQWALFV